MNKLAEKIRIIGEIKAEFELIMFKNGKVENIGSTLFLYHPEACVLRDIVYYRSRYYGLEFEALCMTSSYFVGSKEHAEALKEAYGGVCYPTEYCFLSKNARALFAWDGPESQQQVEAEYNKKRITTLDWEEVKTILF